MNKEQADVVVIGGGPAGTTFATLMQKRGWKVVLLEKDHHPRFHIGESLLPMNLPVFERLGVLEQIQQLGVVKNGADFTVANEGREHQTFHFDRALGNSPDHAFEVRRSEFDQALFEHCRSSGVDAREGYCVRKVSAESGGTHLVEAIDEQGESHSWQARFLVDASGRETFLARTNGWKERNKQHASAAVFGHFKNAQRRPGIDQGNISLYWFEHGWIWMIPLQDDIMSIGAVCNPAFLKTRKGSLNDFLRMTLDRVSEVKQRMQNAEAIVDAQATGNYSYFSKVVSGKGLLLIGDAYTFIDPVFSSGVYLAMSSAEHAVPVAESWLRQKTLGYKLAQYRYRKNLKQGLKTFTWFIYRFNSPAMSVLMSNPRNVLKVVDAVISMLAGDVYTNRAVQNRLLVFKVIYYTSCAINWRRVRTARKARLEGLVLDPGL